MSAATSAPATPVALDAASLTDAMSAPGRYTLDTRSMSKTQQSNLIVSLRRLADASGYRAQNVVTGGGLVFIDVVETEQT